MCWGISAEEEAQVIRELEPFMNGLRVKTTESMEFTYVSDLNHSLINVEKIELASTQPEDSQMRDMMAISYAFHHSVTLESLEEQAARTVDESKQLISVFKETGFLKSWKRRKVKILTIFLSDVERTLPKEKTKQK